MEKIYRVQMNSKGMPNFGTAVEIADRPKGEWIPCTKRGLPLTELGRRERQEWYGYKCSKCNFIYKGNALTESPFCQNCGADMKGIDDVV